MRRWSSGIIGLLILCMTFGASAEVRLTSLSQIDEDAWGGYVVRGENLYLSNERLSVYDVDTGALLRTLESPTEQMRLGDVSDDGAWVVSYSEEGLLIFDEYGELVKTVKQFDYKNQKHTLYFNPYTEYEMYFLPGSSILVLSYENQLFFYDVESNEVTLVRGINTTGELKVSNSYITMGYRDSIQVLNHQGDTVTHIMPEEMIFSYDINRQNQLVYVTYTKQMYRFDNPLQAGVKQESEMIGDIRLDPSGTFIGTSDQQLYEVASGKKIYTNLGRGEVAFNESGSRVLTFDSYDSIQVYATDHLKKRVNQLHIQWGTKSFVEGMELTPSLQVVSHDGSKATPRQGVTWKSNNVQVAYFSNGKLVLKSPGTVQVKATYENHEVVHVLKVAKDSRSSDAEWLKQQRRSLENRRTFLNTPYSLYTPYLNVKGAAGKLSFDQEVFTRGVFHQSVLYGTYRGNKQIEEMVLPILYEKRDITYNEVRTAFGKPKEDWRYDQLSTRVTRGTKLLETANITRITAHMIKNKHALWTYFDATGKARYFHLFEAPPE